VTIEQNDDELDQLLRMHYHTTVGGVKAPEHVLRRVLSETEPKNGHMTRWTPALAFVLAGASFLIILASSRVAEVLLNL